VRHRARAPDPGAGRGGCPIGTLAAALADTDDGLRASLNEAFRAWSEAIHGALVRLRENGLISPGADLDRLTTITLSAIEGGLLLSKTSRDAGTLRTAVDGAIAQLRTHAPAPRQRRRPRRGEINDDVARA
jgi:TetR/AcrR family transcriptional regulator, transcriptional repressor for nem operon